MPNRSWNWLRRALESNAFTCLLLFLFFFAVYIRSIDIYSANFTRFNFLFDVDIGRVSRVFNGIGSESSMHHPLYVLFFGHIGSWLYLVLEDRRLTATVLGVSIASLAAPASYLVFFRLLNERIDALLFTAAVGFSASVWLFSSIPETFAINHLFIILCFLLQDPRYANPFQNKKHFVGYVLMSVAAVGVTLPNLAYVGLAYLNNLRGGELLPSRRVLSLSAYLVCIALLLSGLSALQQTLHPRAYDHLRSSPAKMMKEDRAFLRFDRELGAQELGALTQTFLVDNVVARDPDVLDLQTSRGPQQIVQFLPGGSPLHWLTVCLALGLAGLVLSANRTRAATLRRPVVQLAGAYLAFNFALHLFFRGHGQQFVYSIHLVFSLFAVGASFYAGCTSRMKSRLLVVLVGLLLLNSYLFIDRVNALLDRPCIEKADEKFPICLEWEPWPATR